MVETHHLAYYVDPVLFVLDVHMKYRECGPSL